MPILAVAPPYKQFDPGNGLPVILSTGTEVTAQQEAQIRAVLANNNRNGNIRLIERDGLLPPEITGEKPATQNYVQQKLAEERSGLLSATTFGAMEGVNQENRGDSWMDPARPNTRQSIGQRVALRTRGVFVDRAASSRTMEDHANIILGGGPWAWAPGTRNLVLCSSTHLNNSKYLGTGPAAQRGYKHALRSFLTRITAMGVAAANTRQWTYDSSFAPESTVTYTTTPTGGSTPAQGTSLSTGGQRFRTTTVGAKAFVNVTPSGGVADIVFVARAAGAGLHRVKDAASGTVLGTIDLTQPVAQETPATLRLTGLGNGLRRLQVELVSGSSMTIDSLSVPLPAGWQVPVVFAPAPDVPNGGGNTLPAGDPLAGDYNAAQALYRSMLLEVIAGFPSASMVDVKPAAANWPGGTSGVYNTDQRHLNDLGASQFASRIVEHLSTVPFSASINALVTTSPPTYALPAAPDVPAGGQAGSGSPLASATRDWRASSLAEGAVALWKDAVGNVDLTQTLAAQQPLAVTEEGLKFVRFDGVDDFIANTSDPRPAVETVARLVRLRAPATSSRRYFASSASAGNRVCGVGSTLNNYVMNSGAVLSPAPAVAPDTEWHVMIEVYNGTNSIISIDGVETTGNAGTYPEVVGHRYAVSQGDTGGTGSATPIDVARVVHWNRALSVEERADVLDALTDLIPA